MHHSDEGIFARFTLGIYHIKYRIMLLQLSCMRLVLLVLGGQRVMSNSVSQDKKHLKFSGIDKARGAGEIQCPCLI